MKPTSFMLALSKVVRGTGGMFRCPYCEEDTNCAVVDSRTNRDGKRRRRVCSKCARSFTTYECPNVVVTSQRNKEYAAVGAQGAD